MTYSIIVELVSGGAIMNTDLLVLAITKSILRKHAEVASGVYFIEDFIEDLLYGIYVLEFLIGDNTLANQLKYMSRDVVNKISSGFAKAFLLDNDEFDFDAYSIKEKIWFLMLYQHKDLGKIGNLKKKIILDDVKDWFEEMYMEVKWDESDEFIEILALMSHVDELKKLPIKDIKEAIYAVRLNRYDNKKPDWGLYWLTGNVKYLRENDIFDRKAWIWWKD